MSWLTRRSLPHWVGPHSRPLANGDHDSRPALGEPTAGALVEYARHGVVEVEGPAKPESHSDAGPAAKGARPLLHLDIHRGPDQELLLAAVLEHTHSTGFEDRHI